MFVAGAISLSVFFLELFVALNPTLSPALTLAAMMIATIFGGTLSFFHLMHEPMAGLRRDAGETKWSTFFHELDRRVFYVIFIISFAGMFLSDIRTLALWGNVIIPLRWLYDGVKAWFDSRRMNREIQRELMCPEKIEKPRNE